MTLEYAYEDWCLARLAKPLGRADDYQWLLRRAGNYTNLWDAGFKSMRPRNADGSWLADFAPVGKAGLFAGQGFCEPDAAIYTHFVPQDVPGLIRLFGGNKAYVAALNHQFEQAALLRFVVQHGQHGGAWVHYDNEPSMAMAHMFNFAGAPWLTQKWVREVKAQAYGDITPSGG